MKRVLILLVVAAAAASPAAAQDVPLTHSAYLESTGQLQAAADLEQWLRDQLEATHPEWTIDRRHQNAAFFAFVLAVTGVTAEIAANLQSQGVDVIHGLTADTRPFIEQALLADLVVVGDVVDSHISRDPNDGFETSDVIAVTRLLKGEGAGAQVVIRRRNRHSDRDIVPQVGNRYLLLLNNGMYEFAAARHRTASGDPATETGPHYNIYRIYAMDEDRLLWRNFDREETARAFEEIQLLDELLDASAR